MKSRSLYALLVFLILSSLALSSCQAVGNVQAQPATTEFVPQSVATPDCTQGNQIRAIRAEDQHTVVFELCSPDRTFPAKVGTPAFSIQEDATLSAAGGDPTELSRIANGTGPFRVAESVQGSLRLEKRPAYWGIPVRLRSITFTWDEEPEMRRSNLSVRSVDGISAVDPEDVNSIRLDSYLAVEEAPLVSTVFLGMNNTIAPFDNMAFRQAIAYAFDHQKLAAEFFGPSAQAADQLVPLAFESGHTNSLTWFDYNFKQTSDILRLNGFNFAEPLVLSYDETQSSLIPDPNALALELVLELEDAGVKVDLNPLKTQDFQRALMAGELGLYFTVFKPDYPDASSFFETFFYRDNPMIGLTDSFVTSKIDKSLATSDLAVIQDCYDAINLWIKEQVPLVPLVHTNDVYGFRAMVGSVIIGAFGEDMAQMTTADQSLKFMQSNDSGAFWPVDLSPEDSLRITRLVYDSLTSFNLTELSVRPGLAESWSSNADFTEWTFMLRYDVAFDDGTLLDANDVVATFAAQADASNPNHRADVSYNYYRRFFGNFIKQP